MLDGIQAHDMLKGVRGGDAANRDAMADIIVKVSQLVTDFQEIVELDLNPVFRDQKGRDRGRRAHCRRLRLQAPPGAASDRGNRHCDEPYHAAQGGLR